MGKREKILEKISRRRPPSDISFNDLVLICTQEFGPPRIRGDHFIFDTRIPGNPIVNIQARSGDRHAKTYQVNQVRQVLEIKGVIK